MVEAWAPTQSPQDARKSVADYLKVDVSTVTVHVTLLGGGFGRKSKPDCVCEAAFLAREIGAPVRVQWTREDDLQNSYYHSVAAHRLEAGLDAIIQGDGLAPSLGVSRDRRHVRGPTSRAPIRTS